MISVFARNGGLEVTPTPTPTQTVTPTPTSTNATFSTYYFYSNYSIDGISWSIIPSTLQENQSICATNYQMVTRKATQAIGLGVRLYASDEVNIVPNANTLYAPNHPYNQGDEVYFIQTDSQAYIITYEAFLTCAPTATPTPTVTLTATPTPTVTPELIEFYEYTGGVNTTNLGEMSILNSSVTAPFNIEWGSIVSWKFNKLSVLGPNNEGVLGRIPYNAGTVDNSPSFSNFGAGSTITLEGRDYSGGTINKSVTIELTSSANYDNSSSTLFITNFNITSSTGTGMTQSDKFKVTINAQPITPTPTVSSTQTPTPTFTETPIPTSTPTPTLEFRTPVFESYQRTNQTTYNVAIVPNVCDSNIGNRLIVAQQQMYLNGAHRMQYYDIDNNFDFDYDYDISLGINQNNVIWGRYFYDDIHNLLLFCGYGTSPYYGIVIVKFDLSSPQLTRTVKTSGFTSPGGSLASDAWSIDKTNGTVFFSNANTPTTYWVIDYLNMTELGGGQVTNNGSNAQVSNNIFNPNNNLYYAFSTQGKAWKTYSSTGGTQTSASFTYMSDPNGVTVGTENGMYGTLDTLNNRYYYFSRITFQGNMTYVSYMDMNTNTFGGRLFTFNTAYVNVSLHYDEYNNYLWVIYSALDGTDNAPAQVKCYNSTTLALVDEYQITSFGYVLGVDPHRGYLYIGHSNDLTVGNDPDLTVLTIPNMVTSTPLPTCASSTPTPTFTETPIPTPTLTPTPTFTETPTPTLTPTITPSSTTSTNVAILDFDASNSSQFSSTTTPYTIQNGGYVNTWNNQNTNYPNLVSFSVEDPTWVSSSSNFNNYGVVNFFSGDRLKATNISGLSSINGWTFMFVLEVINDTTDQFIFISLDSGSLTGGMLVIYKNTGHIAVQYQDQQTEREIPISLNTPTLITIVFDGSQSNTADRIVMRKNGVVTSSGTVGWPSITTNWNELRVGAAGNGVLPFYGNMGAFKLFNTVLSSSDITTNENYFINKYNL